jgi:hypothetical protein
MITEADAKNIAKDIEVQGYAFVDSLFSPDEIKHFRQVVRSYLVSAGVRYNLGKTQPNAAQLVPDLHPLFYNKNVVHVFKKIIGADETVFTGHCDIHMNMLSGWHRDSGELYGGYFKGDYMSDPECRVYKMAIYLQDTTIKSGLSVVPGSHRTSYYSSADAVSLVTKAGDAIIFDVRLAHSGQLPDFPEKIIKSINIALKGKDRTVEDSVIATSLKAGYCSLIKRPDRLSVFFTFGADNIRTQQFAEANMVRQNKQADLSTGGIPADLISNLSAVGVKVSKI